MVEEKKSEVLLIYKDATINFKVGPDTSFEYRVLSFITGGRWIIGVCVFEGSEPRGYHIFKPLERGQEIFEVSPITITTGPDRSVTLEFPSNASIYIIDFRSRDC